MARARHWTVLAWSLVVITALSVALAVPITRAQETGDAPHPAHIHSGTCDNLGDIVAPLGDVVLNTAGEVFGVPSAIPVKESETDVELPLGDILAAPHAINIHESAEAIQNYIACGDIGGRVIDGDLTIGLRELNGSGHSGVAILEGDDDDTDVYVYLAEDSAAGGEADVAADAATDDAAAPAADAAPATAAPDAAAAPAAAEVPVDIRDFEFLPPAVELAVGDTVTWTNQGQAPHTATAEDRGALQSGTIEPGSSFSQTFDQAGEFNYFCEFHPNMTGTIVVQ
jgi:plastocyanin